MRRARRIAGIATLVALGLFVVSLLVVLTDVGDADGFTDCYPTCSTWQDVVAYTFWYSLVAFGVAAITFLILLGITLVRRT
jgi:Ni/Fe-hydrogenase subunit HybB-like protein